MLRVAAGAAPLRTSIDYLHHDQLGSTRLLTDAGGKTSATFSYAAYGGVEAKTGSATTPLGFAGQYTDSASGLQYLRARFFDPATGQFMSRDPLQGRTREPYGYAADNPLYYSGPSGTICMSTTHIGPVPVSVPDLSCTYKKGAEEVIESRYTPVAFGLGCYFIEGCTPLRFLIGSLALATSRNTLIATNDPCFDFGSNELEDALFLLAGSAPNGLLSAVARKAEDAMPLTPQGERLLHGVLDAPGTVADVLHSILGGG